MIKDGVLLSQAKYATELLKRVNMILCKSVSTPVSKKLTITSGEFLRPEYSTHYRSIVGGL